MFKDQDTIKKEAKKYYDDNREILRAKKRIYYLKNKDKIKAASAKYYSENAEKWQQYEVNKILKGV